MHIYIETYDEAYEKRRGGFYTGLGVSDMNTRSQRGLIFKLNKVLIQKRMTSFYNRTVEMFCMS